MALFCILGNNLLTYLITRYIIPNMGAYHNVIINKHEVTRKNNTARF